MPDQFGPQKFPRDGHPAAFADASALVGFGGDLSLIAGEGFRAPVECFGGAGVQAVEVEAAVFIFGADHSLSLNHAVESGLVELCDMIDGVGKGAPHVEMCDSNPTALAAATGGFELFEGEESVGHGRSLKLMERDFDDK